MFRTLVIAACIAVLPGCGCNGGGKTKPTKPVWPKNRPQPTATQLVSAIKARQAMVTSYRAKPVMDYWFNKNRIKGDVWIMGKPGAKIRINALNPSGGTTAADLACNGNSYKFVNINSNCQLSGMCDAQSIAQLLRIHLQPDDFLMLAIGSTPIIDYKTSEVWYEGKDIEVLELWSADKTLHQIIKLHKRTEGHDVVSSEVRDAAGKTEWKLRNKGFKELKTKDGKTLRVPSKTNYVQPKEKNADILVYWDKVDMNIDIGDDKFDFELPKIPRCK